MATLDDEDGDSDDETPEEEYENLEDDVLEDEGI